MDDLANAKVGDRLFVKRGSYDRGSIVTVDRITPTGRVVTKQGEFMPDGCKRGERGGFTRTRARIATDFDIAGINRFHMVSKISAFRGWEKLSADDLKAVAAMTDKYAE